MSDLTAQCLQRWPARSYARIGAELGISRAAVSGRIWRARNPDKARRRAATPFKPRPPRPCSLRQKVLELMADERERTCCDVVAALALVDRKQAYNALRVLRRLGLLTGANGSPVIWRWSEVDP